jgi:hypothetical protein
LNTTLHKFCQRINTQRANQRNFYLGQNNLHAASLIPDIPDDSVNKRAIVQDDYSCQGWVPVQKEFVTIAYHKKACLEDLSLRGEKRVFKTNITITSGYVSFKNIYPHPMYLR